MHCSFSDPIVDFIVPRHTSCSLSSCVVVEEVIETVPLTRSPG